jgi:hypothetical protein
MKIRSTVLVLLLTLSIMMPILASNATAYPVTGTPSTTPKIIEWTPTGLTEYATLKWNPEYLKLEVLTPIHTVTTIIVQGKDTYGQNIEAKVVIPPGVPLQSKWIFNDTHTDPPKPVAFAEITGILQQNGTDNSKFAIYTEPEPFEEYLGQFHNITGFEPGKYDVNGDTRQYLVGHGADKPYTVQDVPVEPSNPDPYKIAVNWVDSPNLLDVYDLLPQANEFPTNGAGADSKIWLESLDENGNKVITEVDITEGTTTTAPIVGCTYSTLCKVWGGHQGDSYFIFTEPMPERKLFYYYIIIDHITIQPACYDILAYPDVIDGLYPGVTDITVALRDIDGNLVHAADYGKIGIIDQKIIINFYASGGKIQPSNDVHIEFCHVATTVNITADTNPRTIKVTADANIPKCTWHDPMNLFTWTEMTFDGVNSVLYEGWPIHEMRWGYTDASGNIVEKPVPPKPWLPPELGGPAANGIKLDGPIYEVMIPLYVGCNLISTPVHPILCGKYYDSYPKTLPGVGALPPITIDNDGIPMKLLFGYTSARDCIEAIWWFDAGSWHVYVPGVGSDIADPRFTDGRGYWVKAEKPCTIEISGVFMENGPFTPPLYVLKSNSWTLMGVTSIRGIMINDYLESVSGSEYIKAAGPVWVYYARAGIWVRNPSWGLWPTEAFWVYNKVPYDQYVAP